MNHKFEERKVYSITSIGYKSTHPSSTVRVMKRTPHFVTFLNCSLEMNGFINWVHELERVKIRHTTDGAEYALIFGGIVSDSVYASDVIAEKEVVSQ